MFTTQDFLSVNHFSSSEEALNFKGYEGQWLELTKARLESSGRTLTFAVPKLEQAKKTAGGAFVYKISNKVYQSPESFKLKSFELQAEFRDYDDDYSGLFFWTHGYVLHDKATFTCVVL